MYYGLERNGGRKVARKNLATCRSCHAHDGLKSGYEEVESAIAELTASWADKRTKATDCFVVSKEL